MKNLLRLLVIIVILPLGGFAGGIDFNGHESLDKYLVSVDPLSSVVLEIDKEVRFDCWKNFHYSALYGEGEFIVVLKQHLFHPMVICEDPVAIEEGISIKLDNEYNHPRYFQILVPANANVVVAPSM